MLAGVNDLGAVREVDVAVVGGGLAGSLAALLLDRAGYRVAVVDIHAVFPAEFRCEKLDDGQLELARDLAILDCLSGIATPNSEMPVARRGRLIERKERHEEGFLYHDLVNALRRRFPPTVDFIVSRVADIAPGPERQRLALADGGIVEARLVVLASGLGDALRHKLGMARRMIRDRHSLVFGFSLVPASGEKFDAPALTYYGEKTVDRMGYISLFPVGTAVRANLFTYRAHDAAWARAFRERPLETLFGVMPGLAQFFGNAEIAGKVDMRVVDLYAVENYRRDGVVLVGDAFQTTCPAAGTGVTRVLTDVGRLCTVHVPRWFATPGMGAEKVAQFYDDPVKQACDAHSLRLAEYCRAFSLDNGLAWQARRLRAYLGPRLRSWLAWSAASVSDLSRRPQHQPGARVSPSLGGQAWQPKDSS